MRYLSGGAGRSVFHNLRAAIRRVKTDAWRGRFLDAYGRDRIEPEILRAIAAFEAFG
jgi:aminoglycoside phosphotransferase